MRLVSVPLTPATLSRCTPLWPARNAYSHDEFARMQQVLAMLLAQGRADGVLILDDGDRARAYGTSVFVDQAFLDAYLAAPHPLLGKRILLQESFASVPVLDRKAVGRLNAGRGLHVVPISESHDPTGVDSAAVLARLYELFRERHRGYRLARIVHEFIGGASIAVAMASRAIPIVRVFDEVAPGSREPSVLSVLSREDAVAMKSAFLPLFAYDPPRVLFTAAEQALLRAALDGATDDVLSVRLRKPLSAVKACWARIHQRVAGATPELVEHVRLPEGSRRGAQVRHLVIDYVRNNPSELTPYAPARTGRHAERRNPARQSPLQPDA